MKCLLLLTVLLTIHSFTPLYSQNISPSDTAIAETIDTAVAASPKKHKISYGPLGRFNYTYLRLATFFPDNGFANPIASGFPGSDAFTLTGDLRHGFRLGFESGKVRHFMKLRLGPSGLKLAINSGIALQAFGAGKEERSNAVASTDGFYCLRLGLGPQITFKPIAELRIGLYYRAGIALFYAGYANEQSIALASDVTRVDKVSVSSVYARYNGELGLDCSWRSLCFGISYSMLQAGPSRGALLEGQSVDEDNNSVTSRTYRNGKQEEAVTRTPIDPVLNLNRLGVSFGFAF